MSADAHEPPALRWHHRAMPVGRAERWEPREPRVIAVFGSDADTLRAVGQVFELMELAWHDCYGDVSPPEHVVVDVLVCSGATASRPRRGSPPGGDRLRDLAVLAAELRPR
jgi:hypothetical protein